MEDYFEWLVIAIFVYYLFNERRYFAWKKVLERFHIKRLPAKDGACSIYVWKHGEKNKRDFMNLLYYSIGDEGFYLGNPFFRWYLGVVYIPFTVISRITEARSGFFGKRVVLDIDSVSISISLPSSLGDNIRNNILGGLKKV